MEQSIASLSPEQAQRALIIFYDLLPDNFWEGGIKPLPARIESTSERLHSDAPEDLQPVLEALLVEGREEEKGAAAKTVLSLFYDQESLRGFIEQAAKQAQEPHMAPIPLIIGAVIVLLAALPKDVDTKQGRWKFGHLKDMSVLMKEFAKFAGKLPATFWERFLPPKA